MPALQGAAAYPLAALDTAAGVLSIVNPEGVDLIITGLWLDVSTKSTAACTLDIGVAATAVSANTLMTALDVGTAVGVFDLATNKGASGKTVLLWPAGQYVTASKASGAAAGLVGNAFIRYLRRA